MEMKERKVPFLRINLKSFLTLVTFVSFGVLTVWWAVLFFIFRGEKQGQNLIWAACYQIIALWGGIIGLCIVSRLWGGVRSVMGRAVVSLSAGLLMQVLGQSVFSFYTTILRIDIPYPSLADIGFFGSIPFYVYGIILLGKSSGAHISLKSFQSKLQAVVIPLLMIIVSYLSFLRNYNIDSPNLIRIFLDFGYPFGQAIYISIAILVYILCRGILGGVMRKKILLILFALTVQYIADYNFLYQALKGTWANGGYGDYIYLSAYFLMSLSLVRLLSVFDKDDGLVS